MNKIFKHMILTTLIFCCCLLAAEKENVFDSATYAELEKIIAENYKSDPLAALEAYDRIVSFDEYSGEPENIWKIKRFIANAYLYIGDNSRAFKYFNDLKFSEIYENSIDHKIVFHNDIGDAYKKIGERKKALSNYLNTLELKQLSGKTDRAAEQDIKIGEFYLELDSLAFAEKHLMQAFDYFQENQKGKNLAELRLILANLEIKKRKFDRGFEYAELAAKYFTEKENIAGKSKATHLMGVCKCREGVFGPATKLLDEAIRLASQEKSKLNLEEFYFAKLELLIAKGAADSAKNLLQTIVSYSDSVSLAERNIQLKMFRQRLELEQNVAGKKTRELAVQKNITLFLGIVLVLAVIFLFMTIKSFLNKKRSREILKQKNTELKTTNLKFSSFLEQTIEAITIIDASGEIILWNKYFKDLTGLTETDVLSENFEEVFDRFIDENEEVKSTIYLKIGEIIKPGAEENGSFEIRIKSTEDNKKHFMLSFYPIKTEKEIFIGVICEDISLQKEYELELINAKYLAEGSEKLKTKFLGQMSNEVRSPLKSILNLTSELETELADDMDDDIKDSFKSINSAGERIFRTTNLLLNVSEIQTGKYELNKEKLDLCDDIINPLYEKFKPLANDAGLEIKVINKLIESKIEVDKYSTLQILDNIIDNSVKYTREGGIEILLTNFENKLIVNVKDTGIGIAEEYLEKIFEPFSQEEQGYTRSFEGNGLGLALVKNYCTLNNYEFSINSKKNIGTRFEIVFPSKVVLR